jgi:hypothetical protein
MAAKGVSKIASAAFEPFEKIGKQVGGLAASLPKYAPVLPSSMGGSLAGAEKMVSLTETGIRNRSDARFAETKGGKWAKEF